MNMLTWIQEKAALRVVERPFRSLRAKLHAQQRRERMEFGGPQRPLDTTTVALQRGIMADICQVR